MCLEPFTTLLSQGGCFDISTLIFNPRTLTNLSTCILHFKCFTVDEMITRIQNYRRSRKVIKDREIALKKIHNRNIMHTRQIIAS